MEPHNNSDQEHPKDDLITDYMDEMALADLDFHQSVVKKARNALFLAAVIVFLGEMVAMFNNGGTFSMGVLVIALVETGIFAGLALWTKKKPYNAVIGGLIAFIGIIVLAIVVNGLVGGIGAAVMALIGGIIFKIIILAALFSALKNAKTLQEIQRKDRR